MILNYFITNQPAWRQRSCLGKYKTRMHFESGIKTRPYFAWFYFSIWLKLTTRAHWFNTKLGRHVHAMTVWAILYFYVLNQADFFYSLRNFLKEIYYASQLRVTPMKFPHKVWTQSFDACQRELMHSVET